MGRVCVEPGLPAQVDSRACQGAAPGVALRIWGRSLRRVRLDGCGGFGRLALVSTVPG
jgi:hypothetical protein